MKTTTIINKIQKELDFENQHLTEQKEADFQIEEAGKTIKITVTVGNTIGELGLVDGKFLCGSVKASSGLRYEVKGFTDFARKITL